MHPPDKSPTCTLRAGFTLIELSVVLVIIGLIVGGVLVGQDLIRAASVRAQISQIEKYNSAANTFLGKYGYLPGDIPAGPAAQFGFAARGAYCGQGDGNGLLQGSWGSSNSDCAGNVPGGENLLFWVDLSVANLIDANFSTGSAYCCVASLSQSSVAAYFPQAKVGGGNYIYVWSIPNYSNFFALSAVNGVNAIGQLTDSSPGLTVAQASSIDSKLDDGLPQSGNILAAYVNGNLFSGGGLWASGNDFNGPGGAMISYTTATAGSTASCFDNGNVAGATQKYSVEISNGSNVNCALSFKMQAGD